MKVKELLRYSLIAALALTTAASCKKKDDSPTCRIITATDISGSNNIILNFSYNNDGKISVLTATGTSQYTKIFTYSGNNISITEKDGSNVTTYTYDVVLNSSGLITSLVQKDATATTVYTLTAEYDGSNNLLKLITKSGSNPATTTITTVSGGDVVGYTDGTNSGVLEYYTDKSFQDGDYLKTTQLLQYGALYIANKHLSKSQSYNTDITNYSYDFTDGRISKVTATNGSNIETVTYQYSCN